MDLEKYYKILDSPSNINDDYFWSKQLFIQEKMQKAPDPVI